MKVHPFADRFPMMAKHELAELAESIAVTGLLHPIMMQGETLIDGRNRFKACEIAGVEPRFEQLNGYDPVDYILAVNVARRHLTTGQQAMAMAVAYPEPSKGGRGKKLTVSGGFKDVTQQRLSEARSILDQDDLVERVLAGTIKLDSACKEADERRQAKETAAGQLDQLRAQAPDLYDLVRDGQLDLGEATAALDARRRKERERRETTLTICASAVYALNACGAESFVDFLNTCLADPDFRQELHRRIPIASTTTETVDRGFAVLQRLLEDDR